MISAQENEAEEVPRGSDEIRRVGSGTTNDWRGAMTTRTYTVSEKRALEIAAGARIVAGALKREANRAFWAGEIERATSFLPLISYTEQLADFRS
jgi:hypothetical protein